MSTIKVSNIQDIANNAAMSISGGNVSFPAKPAFRVFKVNHQSVSNGANTLVTWDTELWDIGSNFDLSNNKFVAPINGIYHFDCILRFTASSGTMDICRLSAYLNGSLYCDLVQNHTAANQLQNNHTGGGLDIQLSANDEITMIGMIEGTSPVIQGMNDTYGSRCWFSGHQVA